MANKIEVAKAYVTIVPSLEGSQATITKELTGITAQASEQAGEEGGSKFGAKFGGAVKKAAVAVGAATVATTAAAVKGIASLTTEAVQNFGEYEQLAGGVKKLFGDSANTVIENSSKAFQTAGLSANEYMETVTGFSAALITSLGGDTEAAASLADTALQDMADNANVFGTDMETVMGVYGSLSKGMYTTLDNLKLGFAGTKEGAQSLVETAEKLDPSFKAQRDSAGKLTLAYADMVKAINIVQKDMGIAGATSNEAATTIQGSLGMLAASWTNLLTGLGDKSADLGTLFDNVIESALTVVDNIQPIAMRAVQGISTLIQKLAPVLAQNLPAMINSLMPALTSAVLALIGSLSSVLPTLLKTVSSLIIQVLPVFMKLLPTVLSSVFEMITSLAQWLSEGDNVKIIVDGVIQLVTFLVGQFSKMLPILLPAIVKIVGDVANELAKPSNVMMIVSSALLILSSVVTALIKAVPELINFVLGVLQNLGDMFRMFKDQAWPIFKAGLDKIIEKFKEWGTSVKDFVVGLISTVKEKFTSWIDGLKTSFSDGFEAVKTKISDIIENIKTFCSDAIGKIGELPDKALNIGKDLITGLWNGISDKTQWVLDKIAGIASKITSKVKNVFGVASPSKAFAEIGGFLAEGLGVGWSEEIGNVESDILKSADGLTASMTGTVTAVGTSSASTVTGTTVNTGGNTINVYAAEGQNVEELAQVIAIKLEQMTKRKGAVYA